MSPLARPGAAGTFGKCSRHRVSLVRPAPATLDEQNATERAAAEAAQYLDNNARPPVPRQRARRGDCPECIAEIAAAAVTYLNGDEE